MYFGYSHDIRDYKSFYKIGLVAWFISIISTPLVKAWLEMHNLNFSLYDIKHLFNNLKHMFTNLKHMSSEKMSTGADIKGDIFLMKGSNSESSTDKSGHSRTKSSIANSRQESYLKFCFNKIFGINGTVNTKLPPSVITVSTSYTENTSIFKRVLNVLLGNNTNVIKNITLPPEIENKIWEELGVVGPYDKLEADLTRAVEETHKLLHKLEHTLYWMDSHFTWMVTKANLIETERPGSSKPYGFKLKDLNVEDKEMLELRKREIKNVHDYAVSFLEAIKKLDDNISYLTTRKTYNLLHNKDKNPCEEIDSIIEKKLPKWISSVDYRAANRFYQAPRFFVDKEHHIGDKRPDSLDNIKNYREYLHKRFKS